MTLSGIKAVIEDMQANNLEIGSTIYKICPKCNSNHNGTCEHCAWRGTMNVCDVGVYVWIDGSYTKHELQIVEKKINTRINFTLFKLWNVQYFPTKEAAKKAMKEYDEIRNIPDNNDRKVQYDLWEAKQRAPFSLKRSDEKNDD